MFLEVSFLHELTLIGWVPFLKALLGNLNISLQNVYDCKQLTFLLTWGLTRDFVVHKEWLPPRGFSVTVAEWW